MKLLYLVGFGVIVIHRRKSYSEPRMLKMIRDQIPLVVHSRMLGDFEGLHHMKSKDWDEVLDNLGMRYGFNMFEGIDGEIGLEINDNFLLSQLTPSHDFGTVRDS